MNNNKIHNQFMGGFDVIMISDFYQMPPIQNSWSFASKNIGFSILATNFWLENVKCYELHKIMFILLTFQIGFQLLHKQMKIYILRTILFKTTING